MSNRFLIVFIDSLPLWRLSELPFLSRLHTSPMSPTFGYSEGIKPWMFAGISPSESGMLGLWRIRPDSKGEAGRLLKLADSVTSDPDINRLVRWALRKLGINLDFVPFSKLPHFERSKKHAEDLLKAKWSKHCKVITYRDFYKTKPRISKRDELLFDAAMDAVKDGEARIFVASSDLDHSAHRFGLDSLEYIGHLKLIDQRCRQLCHTFLNRHPDGTTFFFSDHGMCPVKTYEVPDLIGLERLDRMGYQYFIDTTMFRIWTKDGKLDMETHRILSKFMGRFLTEKERAHWGVESRALGDFIFLLNEGVVFRPSYFSLKPALAMHGYHPDIDSQKGIAASHERIELPQTPWEVFEFISELMHGKRRESISKHPDDHLPSPRPVELA